MRCDQPHHVAASYPLPGGKRSERWRAVRKNTGTKKKWPRPSQSYTNAPRLTNHSNLSLIVAQPPLLSLCCQSPPIYAIHLTFPRSSPYPTCTYFHHQHTFCHTVLIHPLQVSKPSQYSRSIEPAPFLVHLDYTHLFMPYFFPNFVTNFSNTWAEAHSPSFSQHSPDPNGTKSSEKTVNKYVIQIYS